MADVALLLETFQKLLGQGHSLIVIEHNLDFIMHADYIIDLGPEGGEEGGRIVAQGDLQAIMASKQSYTGQFLRQRFQNYAESLNPKYEILNPKQAPMLKIQMTQPNHQPLTRESSLFRI